MKPITEFPHGLRRRIRFLLTDVDDTLTFQGRLSAEAYAALERLDRAGIVVVPVTAAPAGWCDLIARMWPVGAVVGENGGFYFSLDRQTRAVRREFWLSADERARSMARLRDVAEQILSTVLGAGPAPDQPFRQITWAIEPSGPSAADEIAAAWHAAGAHWTINSLWVLGWLGDFDKLSMSLRMAREAFAVDLASDREAVLYVGDSLNDEPMFRFFPNSVGVSTVASYLDRLEATPRYVTTGAGGTGFVEVADALLAAH